MLGRVSHVVPLHFSELGLLAVGGDLVFDSDTLQVQLAYNKGSAADLLHWGIVVEPSFDIVFSVPHLAVDLFQLLDQVTKDEVADVNTLHVVGDLCIQISLIGLCGGESLLLESRDREAVT